jgi:hypothetical protein
MRPKATDHIPRKVVMRMDTKKGKTDSARWRDRTIKPLTYAQDRIRNLCDGFLKGQVTSEEFRLELPSILDSRDREKRSLNS